MERENIEIAKNDQQRIIFLSYEFNLFHYHTEHYFVNINNEISLFKIIRNNELEPEFFGL